MGPSYNSIILITIIMSVISIQNYFFPKLWDAARDHHVEATLSSQAVLRMLLLIIMYRDLNLTIDKTPKARDHHLEAALSFQAVLRTIYCIMYKENLTLTRF